MKCRHRKKPSAIYAGGFLLTDMFVHIFRVQLFRRMKHSDDVNAFFRNNFIYQPVVADDDFPEALNLCFRYYSSAQRKLNNLSGRGTYSLNGYSGICSGVFPDEFCNVGKVSNCLLSPV